MTSRTSFHHRQVNHSPRCPALAGYTLIEVLAVVVIIAIAGAVVVPQVLDSGSLRVQAAARAVIADLLFAQNEAITQLTPRRVVFEPDENRYRVADDQGNALNVNWKGGVDVGNNYVIDFDVDDRFDGVQIAAANFADDATVEFDDLGAPSSAGTVELVGGNTRYRVNVAPFTGRITIDLVEP